MANNVPDFWIQTNLNQDPYYEDYSDEKYFNRILYQPGLAVQARELTQQQTILQKQISRFGRHILREGSLVIGGQFDIDTDVQYIKIKNLDSTSNTVNVNNFRGQHVTGDLTGGLVAYVLNVADGDELESNTKTLFVRYTTSGSGGEIVFSNNETLTANSGIDCITLNSNPTGNSSIFGITTGTVFSKGHFINFPAQSVVLERYTSTPNNRVGFLINEAIIDSNEDSTLLDPASGSYNYAAPGADRLRLTANLISISLSNTATVPEFTELFTIKEGVVQREFSRTQYSIVKDELAKRTYDESGDYYVKGLDVIVREHYDNGSNFGYLKSGNTDLLAVGVLPGTAYIKGYEVGTIVTSYLETPKSNTYNDVNSNIITPRLGNYVTCDEFVGNWNIDEVTKVDLYDQAANRISNTSWSSGSPVGNKIGEARVKSVEYNSGTMGTSSAQYNVFLCDIVMNDGKSFANTRSLYYNNASTADMGADPIIQNNAAYMIDTDLALLYPVGADSVRSIRDENGNPDTTFTYKKSFDVTVSTSGIFSVESVIINEIFPYGVGTLTDAEKREILVTFNEPKTITLPGTISTTNGSANLSGSGTSFDYLNVGDKVEINGVFGTHYVSAISSSLALTLSAPVVNTVAGATGYKAYKTGDMIDFTLKGVNAGTTRTVTGNTSTLMSFDMKETFGTTTSATVLVNVSRTSSKEILKTLKRNRYVRIDCGALANTTGPFELGFSDVFKLNWIRKDSSAFTSNTQGVDVTSSFYFNNGQRDDIYDFATITPYSSLTGSDYLLVNLDYFEPDFSQGVGYFSVDSYPINDANTGSNEILTADLQIYKSPYTNIEYDLRNHFDFRPVKSITANDSITVVGATTNPATSNTFEISGGNLRIPAHAQQMTFDFSYYLARIDIVVANPDGTFSLVQGRPSEVPITPRTPTLSMAIASVYIAPFPSLSPEYSQQFLRNDLSCSIQKTGWVRYTMREIGVIDDRVENLEYYAALDLLEKDAKDLLVLDENGLDRFKNGIFVDNFSDHQLGDQNNSDYNICVDEDELSIRPLYEMDSLYYQYLSGSNVTKNGNLITLPWTEATLFDQPYATTYRNIETSIYKFVGHMILDPDTDVWVDTKVVPTEGYDDFINYSTSSTGVSISNRWSGWRKVIVGYRVTGHTWAWVAKNRYKRVNVTFKTKAQAMRYVSINTRGKAHVNARLTVDVIYKMTRVGTRYRTATTTTTTVSQSQTIGDKLVGTELIPYIRSQVINVTVTDLKPNTRFFAFFDGEDINDYLTPADSSFSATAVEGDTWTSNAEGNLYGLLRLADEKKFRVGTRAVVATDSPTNRDEASSYAEAFFVAHGLLEMREGVITSTRGVTRRTTTSRLSQTTGTQTGRVGVYKGPKPSCMAHSFYVDVPGDEDGVFLSSVDVYVAAKHASLGFWVEIRAMDNAGNITRDQVPYSEKWLEVGEINVDSNTPVKTNIQFDSLVFLQNQTEYAFVIHTTGINPDTYFWISQLGENDVTSGTQISSRPLTGNLFTTNNNLDWDIVPGADLKFTLYRAAFSIGSGTATLGNEPIEILEMKEVSSPFSYFGEEVVGGDQLTLTANTGDIFVSDRLTGNTSGITADVQAIEGSVYHTSNTGFTLGETVDVYWANNVAKGSTATISISNNATGFLRKYEEKENGKIWVQLKGSDGEWTANSVMTGVQSGQSGTVNAISLMKYSVTDVEPSYLEFAKTSTTWDLITTSNTGTIASSWVQIEPSEDYGFTTERAILSRSTEIDDLSGTRSNRVRATLSTISEYVSPVIDTSRTHGIYVHNLVNDDITGEEGRGGKLFNKYIGRTVTLAEGQDAEDLSVLITGYRPPGTEIYMWAKIRHREDSDTYDRIEWIRLENSSADTYSSIADPNDFIEYYFQFPDSFMTGDFGAVQYENSANTAFSGYKQFSIKIGLGADHSAVVPRVADLRCVFLQL